MMVRALLVELYYHKRMAIKALDERKEDPYALDRLNDALNAIIKDVKAIKKVM